MPLQATSGAASYDAFGGGAAAVPAYIEEVFSTYLYTGNDVAQTITNGIDLSTKGGLVWIKSRSNGTNHGLYDTQRGTNNRLSSNSTAANVNNPPFELSAFNTTGFTVGNASGANVAVNSAGYTYASWTFRKQPKFFDVVTYTGDGTSGRTISHNLGSTPGCIIVKCLDDAPTDWAVYHRSTGATKILKLNKTDAEVTFTWWNNTAPTSTEFTVNNSGVVNGNGLTYVAYLFASDAGGFGLTGTDNVISCGSFTTDGSGFADINLGYEAQWALVKKSSATGAWAITDNMRGWVTGAAVNTSDDLVLFPNTTNADTTQGRGYPTATGFSYADSASSTYIYIAIRRGPMKVPTSGTSVFLPALASSSGVYTVTTNFPVDLCWYGDRTGEDKWYDFDRLRGNPYLKLNTTDAEVASSGAFDSNVNFRFTGFTGNGSGYINYAFRRAPSFFDVVCYTGLGAVRTVTHNLGVVPELMIVKRRDTARNWMVYSSTLGNSTSIYLNLTTAATSDIYAWSTTTPTSTQFTLGDETTVNASSSPYVAYLFATCAGVSKCTAFTGTGTLQTIDCGFTSGSRFVLIKRTDSTGDWYVWDASRGISSSTDPYLLLNSTAAEVTSTNWVDTTSTGFQVTAASGNNVNINGASYIALAIA
jgi:hypothetical protein